MEYIEDGSLSEDAKELARKIYDGIKLPDYEIFRDALYEAYIAGRNDAADKILNNSWRIKESYLPLWQAAEKLARGE